MQRAEPYGSAPSLLFARLAQRCGDKAGEERVRTVGTALEFGVELAADVPILFAQLGDLNERAVRRGAGEGHARALKLLAEEVIELVAVTVALGDLACAVGGIRLRALAEHAGVFAETHRAALGGHADLVGQERDDRVRGEGGELRAVRVGPADGVARKLDDGDLHTEADAEIGHAVLTRVLRGEDHALDAAVAEAAGHQHARAAAENGGDILRRQRFGIDPLDRHLCVAGRARVEERLNDAQISVVQTGILADERDGHLFVRVLDLLDERRPCLHIRLAAVKAELAADLAAEAGVLKQQWHLIERGGRDVRDHAFRLDVAEQRDLMAHIVGQRAVRAADEDIRLDAEGEQLLDGMLRGLALELAAAGDGDDERNVDKEDVSSPLFRRDLTDRFKERLAFDVAHRTADLRDAHVGLAVVHGVDAAFDLVSDVRNDLHRAAEVAALPLAVEDAPVDLAGGDGSVRVQRLIHEALVVAEVQVGLRAVVGDEDLAVLVGTHRAWVHIKIGVEFLVLHAQPALLQQAAERRRADALAETGHHAAGDKNVLHVLLHNTNKLEKSFQKERSESVPFGDQTEKSRS